MWWDRFVKVAIGWAEGQLPHYNATTPAELAEEQRLAETQRAVEEKHLAEAQRAVEEKRLAELGADIAAGRLTSEALTTAYLARIAALDRSGPELHSVIAINPDALAQARALDADGFGAEGPVGGEGLEAGVDGDARLGDRGAG